MDTTPLLMSLPQLLGARNAIQYINHQPMLPGSTMPQAPQMGHAAQMPSLPNMPSQQAQPQQAQQDPMSMFGGSSAMQGAMQNMNLPYWGRSLFGIGTPSSNLSAFNITPSGFNPADFTMPKIFG